MLRSRNWFYVTFCFYLWRREQSVTRQNRVSSGETQQQNIVKECRGILGTRAEICMEFPGAVQHGPKVFERILAEFSANTCTQKNVLLSVHAAGFPLLWLSPEKNRRILAQRLLETPLPPLSVAAMEESQRSDDPFFGQLIQFPFQPNFLPTV